MNTMFEVVHRIANGGSVTQDDALAVLVNGSHAPTDVRRARLKVRNAALIEAASYLDGDGATEWEVARRLEMAVKRFGDVLWVRIEARANPELSPCEIALKKAFSTEVHVIGTQENLYRLLLT